MNVYILNWLNMSTDQQNDCCLVQFPVRLQKLQRKVQRSQPSIYFTMNTYGGMQAKIILIHTY